MDQAVQYMGGDEGLQLTDFSNDINKPQKRVLIDGLNSFHDYNKVDP